VTEPQGRPVQFPVEGLAEGSIRIRLRVDSDAPEMIAALQDPEIPRWTRVPESYDESTAAEWAVESRRQQQAGEGLHLVIADAGNGAFLGSIGIHDIDRDEARCNIGYYLAREARGRGVITHAVRMLSRWAFDNLPVDRIEIPVIVENHASRRVAERAGYEFEGVLRSHTVIKGRRRDIAMYSLLRGELRWP
jgi:RimJ/RimL family protein N-acetyltransferase